MNPFANFEKKASELGLSAEESQAVAQEAISFVTKIAQEQEKTAETSVANYAEGFCKTALENGFDVETVTELYKVAETVKEAKGLPPALRAYLDKKRAEKGKGTPAVATPAAKVEGPKEALTEMKLASERLPKAYVESFLKTASERGVSEKQANEMLQHLLSQLQQGGQNVAGLAQANPEAAGAIGGGLAGAGAGALAGGEGNRSKGALIGGAAGAGLGAGAGAGYRIGGEMKANDITRNNNNLQQAFDADSSKDNMGAEWNNGPKAPNGGHYSNGLPEQGNLETLMRHLLGSGVRK